jgi:hypothetical protein
VLLEKIDMRGLVPCLLVLAPVWGLCRYFSIEVPRPIDDDEPNPRQTLRAAPSEGVQIRNDGQTLQIKSLDVDAWKIVTEDWMTLINSAIKLIDVPPLNGSAR